MHYPYLPDFNFYTKKLTVNWVKTQIEQAKQEVEFLLAKHKKNKAELDFNFIYDLEEVVEKIHFIFEVINHLTSVTNTPKIRKIHSETLNDFNSFWVYLSQNERIYHNYLELKKSFAKLGLNKVQKRLIEKEIENFELNGVGLSPTDKIKYKKINQELLKLNKNFSDNILDDTDEYSLVIDKKADLAGLPTSVLTRAKAEAKQQKVKMPAWVFTLKAPSYLPFMKYSKISSLRKKLYLAFITRATKGKRNNSPIIKKILELRKKKAKLLGFKNHAVKQLKTRMAKSPQAVTRFLNNLKNKSSFQAKKEKQQIIDYNKKLTNAKNIDPWDITFLSERIKEKKFSYDEEKIKEYFPTDKVLSGLFDIVKKLFDYQFVKTEAKREPKKESRQRVNQHNVWDKEVQFYNVINRKSKQLVGHLYLDLYARAGKRGGAWLSECLTRKENERGKQLPVAYLITNFTPPNEKNISLLTHLEVVTLFHEMGHVLHHLLTKVDYLPFSGINGVPWDGVELPSQFLENWAWNEKGLRLVSSHFENKKPLPKKYFSIIKETKNFNSALAMLRQLEFALLDMHLHLDFPEKTNDPHEIIKKVRGKVSVWPRLKEDRFENSFSHIFAGGYSAGYYSYKWAEVLAADAFSVFIKEGIFNKKWATLFLKNILEKGGSEDFMDLYLSFRGKNPDPEALLQQSGIKVG